MEGISLYFGLTLNPDSMKFKIRKMFRQFAQQHFNGDIIHLQHGVVFGDISMYLNQDHEKFSFIASASQREHDYMNTLNLPKESIRLTGFPKNDVLESITRNRSDEKYILFAPSYDRNALPRGKYERMYKLSPHYKFISSILNSELFAKLLAEHGYKLLFKPHPHIINNLVDLNFPDHATIVTDWDCKYDTFKKSAILITDYSGIAFEFAYLKKPIVYAHFAESTKYEETYWTYTHDGYGNICSNLCELISEVQRLLEADSLMPEVFQSRVASFYSHFDSDNCKRVYNAIMN